jgi:hypothetical protein
VKTHPLWIPFLILAAAACDPSANPNPASDEDPPWRLPSRDLCPGGHYEDPEALGRLQDPRLVEISGLATSLIEPGLLWGHNDSGDEATLYAFSEEGHAVGEVQLAGTDAMDFEDIESAPCPHRAGPCLWVADTGDNDLVRQDAALLVIPEPEWAVTDSDGVLTREPLRFAVSYPGGPVNVEALAIAPDLSHVLLFEKVDGPRARIFELDLPLQEDQINDARVLTTIDSPGVDVAKGKMITAANFHLSGERLLLRVYTGVFEYQLNAPGSVEGLEALIPSFSVVGPLAERQGEAVTYDGTGEGILTVSEDPERQTPGAIHHARCSSP